MKFETPRFRSFVAVVCAALVLPLAANCGSSSSTPEDEVRAVLAAAEEAAEARDTSGAMAMVSSEYADDNGFDKARLRDFVRGYFLAHPTLEVLLRIEAVEFAAEDFAKATVTLVVLGQRTGIDDDSRFAADGERYALDLVRESSNWRLRRVSRANR